MLPVPVGIVIKVYKLKCGFRKTTLLLYDFSGCLKGNQPLPLPLLPVNLPFFKFSRFSQATFS